MLQQDSLTSSRDEALVVDQGSEEDISASGQESELDDEMAVRYDQSWLNSLLRPALIAVLAACLCIALLSFLRHALPWLPSAYTGTMITLGVIASIIGCFSTTWMANPAQRMRRTSPYRVAEFALLLGITRLATWITVGNWPSLEIFLTLPLETLLDGYFILGFLVMMLSWGMATIMTTDLLKIALQPDEIYAAQLKEGWRGDYDPTPPNYTDRRAVLQGFVARWLAGGVLLILLAAGSRLGKAENGFFALTKQNIAPTVITAIIIYFLTGLVLASQGQLAVLRARWTLERVPSTSNILRNWPLYSLLLIIGMGVLAALMPFGGTFLLAQIIATVVVFIYQIVFAFFQTVLGLFMMLASLFGGEETDAPPPPPPEIQQPLFEELPQTASELPPWLGGSLFWLFMALLLGYAAYIYFSGKGFNFVWLKNIWRMLRERWQLFFGSYQEWQMNRQRNKKDAEPSVADTLRSGLGSWLRLRNLNPEQQVRYFYLSTLERAERAGMARHPSETPLQYAPRLVRQITEQSSNDEQDEAEQHTTEQEIAQHDIEQDIEEVQKLTEAFVQVRYAGKSVEEEQIPYLKRLWEQLKRALRGRRQAE